MKEEPPKHIQPLQTVASELLKANRIMLRRSVRHSAQREPKNNDVWDIDAPFYQVGEQGSYDYFFHQLLREEGFESFQDLLKIRKQAGLSTHALDLFGSGFFIEELEIPDSITGVRLLDSAQETVRQLRIQQAKGDISSPGETRLLSHAIQRIQDVTSSPKWSITEGNLFVPTTWEDLDSQNAQRGITAYDLIVAKPEGAFHDREIFSYKDWHGDFYRINEIYSLKFLRLLNRAYTRLSPDNGMLFTEVPRFIADSYLDRFVETIKTNANVRTGVMDSEFYPGRKNLKLVKQPSSIPNLERLAA